MFSLLELICKKLQNQLKKMGDWTIYPFAVHKFIGMGRVAVDCRDVYLDGTKLPVFGYRMPSSSEPS
jgi:hypothetical protein